MIVARKDGEPGNEATSAALAAKGVVASRRIGGTCTYMYIINYFSCILNVLQVPVVSG